MVNTTTTITTGGGGPQLMLCTNRRNQFQGSASLLRRPLAGLVFEHFDFSQH